MLRETAESGFELVEFVEATARRPAVIAISGAGPAAEGARAPAPVIERWYPRPWDGLAILRWWVLRTPWGSRGVTGAALYPD